MVNWFHSKLFQEMNNGGYLKLDDKKIRLTLAGSIIILSICILFAASSISSAINHASRNSNDNEYLQYEIDRLNENIKNLVKTLQENQ